MFVTKKALPRRTFLLGVGTTMALPLLESMVPAFTALAQTPARGPLRFGAVYFPNGATNKHWFPDATGRATSTRRFSSRSNRSVIRSPHSATSRGPVARPSPITP